MKLTASFRVVKGHVSELTPAPGEKTRGAGEVVDVSHFLKIRVKPPRGDHEKAAPASPPACRGPWTAAEDACLKEVMNRLMSTERPFRWKEVATLVETRDARQCSYRWTNHLSPEKLQSTPPRNRKKKFVADDKQAGDNPLKSMMNEFIHLVGDESHAVSVVHDFAVALGEDHLEDVVTPEGTLGIEVCESKDSGTACGRKRRLDFNYPGNNDCQEEDITSCAQVESLLKAIEEETVPAKKPKFEIRVVPKVSYKSTERKAVMHTLNTFDDRHFLVGAAKRINCFVGTVNVAY